MWTIYDAEVRVKRLTAGIPANPNLLQAWLDVNSSRVRPPGPAVQAELSAASIPSTPEEIAADQQVMHEALDPEETHAVVFYRGEDGEPYLESRNIKAAFKEAANILKGHLKETNYRAKLAERVFAGPALIPLRGPVYRAERPISVMTMKGPRTSLKRYEYMLDVPIPFYLKVLDDGVIKEGQLLEMLKYLRELGLGADRSQGSGTFEIVHFGRR